MPFGGFKNFDECVAKNKDQANPKAYCAAIMRKAEGKEIKLARSKISLKEGEKSFFSEGFIATTHPDRAENSELGVEGDILSEGVIDKIVEVLNDPVKAGHPEASQVSYRHDYIKQGNNSLPPAGVNSTVEKRQTEDGQWGAFVSTEHTSTFPDKDKLIYEIDKNIIPGYSIEYNTLDYDIVTHEGKEYRFIKDIDFKGYGFANGRAIANPQAAIVATGYKEMIDSFKTELKQINEVKKMKKDEVKEDAPKEEPKEEPKVEAKEEPKEETPKEDKKDEPATEGKEIKEFNEFKKFQKANEEIKEKLKKTEIKDKPTIELKEKIDNKKTELKEISEFKEKVLGEKKAGIPEQYRIAARLEASMKEKGAQFLIDTPFQGATQFEIKENKIELKAGSAVTTDTDYAGAQTSMILALSNYEQTPSRYNDIYGPVIINQLNDITTTWNLLRKDNMTGMSAIRIRARTARNSTAGHYVYGSTPGWDGNSTIKKFNQHFITSYVEIAVEFEAIEFAKAPGGVGDAFAIEVENGTKDLMTVLNGSGGIFGTGDGTAEDSPLGFDGGLIRTSGNLYGKTVTDSGFTTLAAAGVDAMGDANITLKKMRSMKTACVTNGARIEDLVYVCSHLQRDFILALIQDIQRIVPTSARVGFTGIPEFDGMPIYADKDLDAASMTDDLFLIDMATTKIGIKKPATYQEFSLVALERRGIVWMMWNLFSDNPNHNYHINGLATS